MMLLEIFERKIRRITVGRRIPVQLLVYAEVGRCVGIERERRGVAE